MINNPYNGFSCTFSLTEQALTGENTKKFVANIFYGTNIPDEIFNAFEQYFSHGVGSAILAGEYGRFILTLTHDKVYIVEHPLSDNRDEHLTVIHTSIYELAREFSLDIKRDIKEWAKFYVKDVDEHPDVVTEIQQTLLTRAVALEAQSYEMAKYDLAGKLQQEEKTNILSAEDLFEEDE